MLKKVSIRELNLYTPAFLGAVKDAWKKKKTQNYWEYIIYPTKTGVSAKFAGSKRVQRVFPKYVLESPEFDRWVK